MKKNLRRNKNKDKTRKLFHKSLFFNGKSAKGGLISLGLGLAAIVLLVISILCSYLSLGQGAVWVGSLSLLALFIAAFGIYMGFRGLKEEDKLYLSCKIGIIMNAIIVTFVISIYGVGLLGGS